MIISYNNLSLGSFDRLETPDRFETYEGRLTEIAGIISNYIWSPILWQGGHRKRTNFVETECCALDFENPNISVRSAKIIFSDYTHVIGTTRNHGKVKGKSEVCDRFRVLIPFERAISDIAEYETNMKRIISMHGSDKECFDAARVYLQCMEIVSVNLFGAKMEILKMPDVLPIKKVYVPGQFADRWMARDIPYSQRRNIPYAIGADLRRTGMGERGALEYFMSSYAYRIADEIVCREMLDSLELGFHAE